MSYKCLEFQPAYTLGTSNKKIGIIAAAKATLVLYIFSTNVSVCLVISC
jgi:hypothetical protein